VLVPGCGRGHDVQALGAHEDIAAAGLDLSETAIVQAKARMLQDDRTANISFIVGDFFHIPAQLRRSFDWLVEHTCFCAIDPACRPDYVRAAATALRTGGRIFGIFFLTPDVDSGPPFAVSREELSELFDSHFSLVEEWTPRESFPGREERELIRVLLKK
jgi:SAM-dependent methyltransferase